MEELAEQGAKEITKIILKQACSKKPALEFLEKEDELYVRITTDDNLAPLMADYKLSSPSDIGKVAKKHVQNIEAKRGRIRKETVQRLEKDGLLSNIISKVAVDMVKQNEKYITKNMLVHYIRGLKLPYGVSFNSPGYRGKFAVVPSEDIEKVIAGLARNSVISEYEVKGKYGYFDLLKTGSRMDMFYEAYGTSKHRKMEDYSDIEVISLLEKEKNMKLSERQYTNRLFILNHPSVFCSEKELFLDFFANAPDSIVEYIKTMRKLESSRIKKQYYKEILDYIENTRQN